MGVLNVTPDSFSDGGRFFGPEAAVAHGLDMVEAGADVVDVGGESSRPGAEPVPEAEELRRVVGVVEALAPHVRVSVDTVKPGVAEAAVAAGATLVNDISASLWPVAATWRVGWIAMHMQGEPKTMQAAPRYDVVVDDVRAFLVARANMARDAGVEEVWVDPGIGFGKTPDHNLSLLRHLRALVAEGFGVVVGTSRKSFIGAVGGAVDGGHAPANARLGGSIAGALAGAAAGVAAVRVHDVRETVQALRVWRAIAEA